MVKEISVFELETLRKTGQGPHVVDVRTEEEFEIAQLPASQLIVLNELQQRLGEIRVARTTPIAVLCHHGVRSKSGAAILMAAGFSQVTSVRGGIDAWSREIDPNIPTY